MAHALFSQFRRDRDEERIKHREQREEAEGAREEEAEEAREDNRTRGGPRKRSGEPLVSPMEKKRQRRYPPEAESAAIPTLKRSGSPLQSSERKRPRREPEQSQKRPTVQSAKGKPRRGFSSRRTEPRRQTFCLTGEGKDNLKSRLLLWSRGGGSPHILLRNKRTAPHTHILPPNFMCLSNNLDQLATRLCMWDYAILSDENATRSRVAEHERIEPGNGQLAAAAQGAGVSERMLSRFDQVDNDERGQQATQRGEPKDNEALAREVTGDSAEPRFAGQLDGYVGEPAAAGPTAKGKHTEPDGRPGISMDNATLPDEVTGASGDHKHVELHTNHTGNERAAAGSIPEAEQTEPPGQPDALADYEILFDDVVCGDQSNGS